MTTFHVTITSSFNKSEEAFEKKPPGTYDLTHFLQPGQNYTVSVKGEIGGLLTPNACTGSISLGTGTQMYNSFELNAICFQCCTIMGLY